MGKTIRRNSDFKPVIRDRRNDWERFETAKNFTNSDKKRKVKFDRREKSDSRY